MQLSQVIDGFFIVRRTRLAPTTQTNYRYCFQRLTNFLGSERDFASITASDIRAFIDHLQNDGLSDRSVHDNLAICSALWTFAESEFKLPHVVKEVERPDYNKKEIIPFTGPTGPQAWDWGSSVYMGYSSLPAAFMCASELGSVPGGGFTSPLLCSIYWSQHMALPPALTARRLRYKRSMWAGH